MYRKVPEEWLQLWRWQNTADPQDRWKWSWDTWRPIAEKLLEGPIDDVPCPVCGRRTLRYYLIVGRKTEVQGKKKHIADIWISCETCQVQNRGKGLMPEWFDPESVDWVSP